MNETFVRARTIYDRMMEESFKSILLFLTWPGRNLINTVFMFSVRTTDLSIHPGKTWFK